MSNRKVKALIDSGASRNCISEQFFSNLNIPKAVLQKAEINSMMGASGSLLKCVGIVTLFVNCQGLSIPTVFHVLENLSIQCILGITFLQDNDAVLDCKSKRFISKPSTVSKRDFRSG
jgi:gag-polyprotein putative aspartyl protease